MNENVISPFNNKKIALVLSGGVTKAASWHIGVAKALNDLGFSFKHNSSQSTPLEISTYVGSSAGSLICLYLAAGYNPDEIIRAYLKRGKSKLKPVDYSDMLSLKRYSTNTKFKKQSYNPFSHFPFIIEKTLKPLLKTNGIFSTYGLRKYINQSILEGKKDFSDFDADLFIVATQLDHSKKVIFSKYLYPSPYHDPTATYSSNSYIDEAVTASMSVPPFYTPTPVKNNESGKSENYIDGEIRETLSTHVAIDNKCDFVISSWTHTPYHYQKEIGSLVNYGLPAICTQAIYLMIQKKIVDSRARRSRAKDVLDTVKFYLESNKFNTSETNKLLSILERKLNFNPNIEFIDICPLHENYELFFKNPFSLNPKTMKEIADLGHKRTIDVFKKHNLCI